MHARFSNQSQTAPFAVTFYGKNLGDGVLRQQISRIWHDAAILIFDHAQGCYFLLNQHVDALQ